MHKSIHSPKSVPWRGQNGHVSNTSTWLANQQQRCGDWPHDGLNSQEIVHLVDILPELMTTDPKMFVAAVDVIKAQHSSPTWKNAVTRRLNMIGWQRSLHRLSGNHILLSPRKHTWSAQKNADHWSMLDGSSLDEFAERSRKFRKKLILATVQMFGIQGFEFPICHLDLRVWANTLHAAKRWLNSDHPVIASARAHGIQWTLAVRRIKKLRVRGMYDSVTKTIVVDPRHPEALIHELAHMVLGHNLNTPLEQAEQEVDNLLHDVKLHRKKTRHKRKLKKKQNH